MKGQKERVVNERERQVEQISENYGMCLGKSFHRKKDCPLEELLRRGTRVAFLLRKAAFWFVYISFFLVLLFFFWREKEKLRKRKMLQLLLFYFCLEVKILLQCAHCKQV